MLKTIAKAAVPPATWAWLREQRDLMRFRATRSAKFEHQRLIEEPRLRLADIFSSPVDTWQSDHAAIAAAFGDANIGEGVNPGDRRALYYLVRAFRPRRVLEIGTHIGASTLYIARALKANGAGMMTTVDVIDVNGPAGWWRKVGLAAPPRDLVRKVGCRDLVDFVVAPAERYMASVNHRFDFIFLDGDHSATAVYRELGLALELLEPEGLILLHDYHESGAAIVEGDDVLRGPFRAMQRVRAENPQIVVRPFGELPWETKRGFRLTSLAAVVRQA